MQVVLKSLLKAHIIHAIHLMTGLWFHLLKVYQHNSFVMRLMYYQYCLEIYLQGNQKNLYEEMFLNCLINRT